MNGCRSEKTFYLNYLVTFLNISPPQKYFLNTFQRLISWRKYLNVIEMDSLLEVSFDVTICIACREDLPSMFTSNWWKGEERGLCTRTNRACMDRSIHKCQTWVHRYPQGSLIWPANRGKETNIMCEEGLTNRRQTVNRLLPLRPLYANLICKKGHSDCDYGKGLIGKVKGSTLITF